MVGQSGKERWRRRNERFAPVAHAKRGIDADVV